MRRYKIKGRWEYIVKPELVLFISEGESEDDIEYTTHNKFWCYFRGEQLANIWAMTTAPDGNIWVAGEKGLIAY